MQDQGFSGQQIAGQIKRWHPDWTQAEIDHAMMTAHAPVDHKLGVTAHSHQGALTSGLPTDYGSTHLFEPHPYHPREGRAADKPLAKHVPNVGGRDYATHGHSLEHRIAKTLRETEKEIQLIASIPVHDAKALYYIDRGNLNNALQEENKARRASNVVVNELVREAKAHAADLAIAASILALVTPPPANFAFAVLASGASFEAGREASRRGHHAEAALDYVSALAGPVTVLARVGVAVQGFKVARGVKGLTQFAQDVRAAPVTSPSLTEAERNTLTRLTADVAVARKGAKGLREADLRAAIAGAIRAAAADPRVDPQVQKHK